MIEEKLSDQRIPNTQIWQSVSDEFAEIVEVVRKEDIPIDIFGHRNLHFLLLISLDIVYLRKYYET